MPPMVPGSLGELYGGQPAYVDAMTDDRSLYNEIIWKYRDAPAQLAIQQADLISEIKTAETLSLLTWNFRVNDINPGSTLVRDTEIRLQDRDSFCFNRMGLMFALETTASTSPGSAVFHQWPNPALTAVGGLDVAAPAVITAFNGVMKTNINSVDFLKNLSAARMIYAGEMQRGTLTFTASNTAWNSQEGDKGFVSLTPAMDIKGKDSIQFFDSLPDPANFGALAANSVVCRLVLRGFLIQGGAAYI